MMRGAVAALAGITFLLAIACSTQTSDPRLIVEIPSGFTGDFVLEMGARNAAPLQKQGDSYVVTVDRSGKVATSTLLKKAKVTFRNASSGGVWGYSESMFTTGDGIAVGGKIEFFLGTRKDYEAEQGKRNHSGKVPPPSELDTSGM